ncbi:MAG: hypothetical protein GF387_02915 [Candidatus Portnoybacteria bacterium]|nr:hypothetical protein [Candidatus Portnoybacteria bacterium]
MKKEKDIFIPQSSQETNRLIQEIGEFQVKIENAKKEEAEKIKRIKNKTKRRTAPTQKAIKRRFVGLYIFYTTHKYELPHPIDRKIIKLLAGEMGIFKTPPKVNLRNKKKIIREIEKNGPKYFLKQITDIDKEVMIKNKEKASRVPGVTITRTDKFRVTPKETGSSETASIKDLKKFIQ